MTKAPNPRQTMKLGRRWLLPTTIALLVVGGAVGEWIYYHRGWTESKVESLIRTELSLGCDRIAVAAWFDRHKIPHIHSRELDRHMQGHLTMPDLAGLDSSKLSSMESGRLEGPGVNVHLIMDGRITIYFFFDKQGQLVGHYVNCFAIGL